jgi:hypothetical protein
MVAWTDSNPTSRVFIRSVQNPLTQKVNPGSITLGTGYSDIVATDTINAALFNGTLVSPDASAAMASIGYNTGTWVTGSEVTGAGIWAAGGRPLGTKAYTLTAGTQTTAGSVGFTAANLAGAGTGTLTNAYGCLVYDASITAGTVANQGLCFNYFGGAQTVTGGTFQINWDATGVFKFTN